MESKQNADVLWTANTNIYVLGEVSYEQKVVYKVTV